MPRKIFINLPVADPKRSMEFFSELGFDFNPHFTDDNAACMIVNEEAYVMLLRHEFFQGFTKNAICDTAQATESLMALSCEDREGVDEIVNKAIDAGGTHAMDSQDHGFMYAWSFYDLDRHHWEVFYMDESAAAGGPSS